MSQAATIPQNPTLTPAEDFFELRRRGIGFIEDMGSRWWTDYNLHDPGITILEALCYAITDLAYRTGWNVQDLLTQENGRLRTDQSFFTAKDVLAINPLTTNDYRKLLVDIKGVRNAWITCKECACEMPIYVWCDNNQVQWGYQQPAAKPSITFKPDLKPQGLYEVLLLLEDKADEAVMIQKVKETLHAHRNLDEDFCGISTVPVEKIAVCADVEVMPDADLERVQAEMWWKIEQYLNPPVPTYSLVQLQEQQVPTEEIFNGPPLENGFIKNEDLEKSELKREVRTSDIINLLADIEGVKAVSNLLITKYNTAGQPIYGAADGGQNPNQLSAQWVMRITAGHQPIFDFDNSRLLFYKNSFPFLPDATESSFIFDQLKDEAKQGLATSEDLPLPTGTYRNATDYYPIQYSLPATYGVGELGLPSHVSDERRTQALQLKGYLMLFEQLLLNAHTQLAHIGDVFSSKASIKKTYFTTPITDTLIEGSSVLLSNTNAADLQKLVEKKPAFEVRRNRFLDHLLARFGENLNEYALLMHKQDGTKIPLSDVIDNKLPFLQNQAQLAQDRAKAFDYQKNTGISGLQNRIQKLLNFEDKPDVFFVVEHLLLRPKFPGDALFDPCATCDDCGPTDPYSFRLTFMMDGGEGSVFNTDLNLRRFAERIIRQETPAHLLSKICWIDNDGLDYDPNNCHANERFVIQKMADLLVAPTKERNNSAEACRCAEEIFLVYHTAFKKWLDKNKHFIFNKAQIINQLEAELKPIDLNKVRCVGAFVGANNDDVFKEIRQYFADVSVRGLQFERFKEAWQQWRKANAKMDWTSIRLHQDLEKLTNSCECTHAILSDFGQQFYEAMKAKIAAGKTPDKTIVDGLKIKTLPCATPAIEAYLKKKYKDFVPVSHALWQLIGILETLENTYPVATLHDCADGNDDNPVRLGSTALGSN